MASRTVTRYGSRYGRTIRERVSKAEEQYKEKQSCPYCSYKTVKRLAAGIWQCSKCRSKFTSRAYQLRAPPSIKSKEEHENV